LAPHLKSPLVEVVWPIARPSLQLDQHRLWALFQVTSWLRLESCQWYRGSGQFLCGCLS
ncbi:hypothetical protein TorRG33x02_319870, partial [Trema orientale]